MKKIILTFISIFASLAINAQSVIIDISESGYGQPTGYYRKDINNLLNQFEGTYVYTNGNKVFTMTLIKKIKQYNGSYYEDLIIGEFKYEIDGLTQQNTLNNLNVIYNNQFAKHAIAGRSLIGITNRQWKCSQCSSNEQRLRAKISDRSTETSADFFMRRTSINGQQVMQVKIANISKYVFSENNLQFSLPQGEFTMIKQ